MTFKGRKWLLAAGLVLGLLVGGYSLYLYCLGHGAAREVEQLLGRFDTAHITFLQLDGDEGPSEPDQAGRRRVRDIWPTMREISLAPNALEEFRSIATSPWSYSDTAMTCFEPGMAVVFVDGGRRLEVVMCLKCARMRIWENGDEQTGRWFLSRRGIERLYGFYNTVTGKQ